MALPTTGTSRLGVMPDAGALKQIPRTGPEDQQEDIRLEDRLTNQTASGRKEQPVSEDTAMLSASSKKPQYFLAAPGLPTITSKLAQQIWDLEFVEMEEFLTSNKTMQALEQQFNPKSVQDGVLGALQQLVPAATATGPESGRYHNLDSLLYIVHCGYGEQEGRLNPANGCPYACSPEAATEHGRHDMASIQLEVPEGDECNRNPDMGEARSLATSFLFCGQQGAE